MVKRLRLLAVLVLVWTGSASAQYAIEGDVTETGVVNPSDITLRSYLELMTRFPDRVGIICSNAYLLDKTGDHSGALPFFVECARRGNAPSMVYLAYLYEEQQPAQLDQSAHWLAAAARTGYPLAEFHWGVAQLLGRGTPTDVQSGQSWIRKAAKDGNKPAQDVIDADFQVTSEGKPIPCIKPDKS